MSDILTSTRRTPPCEPITLSGPEAAKFSGLSAKMLDRRPAAGQPVGRVKVGRRVVYLKAPLEAWLTSMTRTGFRPAFTRPTV